MSDGRGCPFASCPGWASGGLRALWCVSAWAGVGAVPGCRRAGCRFPWRPGSARYGSRWWRAERALGRGKAGGVRGTGKPGFGGFPGSPVPCRLPGSAGAAGTVVLAASVAMRAAGSVVPCAFHGHWCGGVRRGAGEVRRGSGGTSEPGRGLRGRGVPGFPQMPVPPFLLLPFRSLSRAVVFPTSPSCLVEGVRSGTRKRRGASTSVQAAGGTGAGTPRTSPAHACAGLVRLACGLWPGRARARRAGAPGPARAYKPAARVFAGRH